MATFDITVSLSTQTCLRGHLYAVPQWVADINHQCPMCASDRLRQLVRERDHAENDVESLNRRISHLKGALTRAKKLRTHG